ncbi:peroxiredoxin [Pseudomarimonas arenosa]|uniref:thioredoxin-dependent peroxiredoxin n=1 Tax=Pseudomarimonas arenosa TaxID=2774145 RepID=A0AAW3ZLB0_9GAMM|nr:peroxiredoxin [Pseudomarimonas arenosa]MBD8526523.1 peroxiredoxin [Pseudomarimonas arenosa]
MLQTGDKVPKLKVTLQDGRGVPLSQFKDQWWVLFFYPKDSTPGCTTENREFSALLDKFKALGATVLGASRDSQKSHSNFCSKQELAHDLISDPDSELCDAFGVIQEKSLYGRKYLGIERSTFLIAPGGKIHTVWRKVKVKQHAEAVLAALEAAQK